MEDILNCETVIDPSDLLDNEEKLDITMAIYTGVPEELKKELMDIIQQKMKDVWSQNKWDIGVTNKLKHDIQTEGKVVKDKKRPIPYPRLQYAKKAINTLMKYNLVSPAFNSKWAANRRKP